MDTSIRLYHMNSSLRTPLEDERERRPTVPLSVDGDGCAAAHGREEETIAYPAPSEPALAEPIQKIEVADFEAIFLRFQAPITNFIYHLIGNREQAYDLAQDVFVKAYKALLNGTVAPINIS